MASVGNQASFRSIDSSIKNAQLAQMVGYTNDVVFIRAFKKLEGVTPGKYRVSASGE